MSNNNLPPSWGNKNNSAKPNWGNNSNLTVAEKNEKADLSDNDKQQESISVITQVEKAEDSITSDDKNTENILPENESTENIFPINKANDYSEIKKQDYRPELKKTSKAPVVVLSILLVISIIDLGFFAWSYFDRNSKSNKDDVTNQSEKISKTATETTTPQTTTTAISHETSASNTTTTTTSTTTVTRKTTETTTEKLEFESYTIQIVNPTFIYKEPKYTSDIVGEIDDFGKYTIVDEYIDKYSNTWGKLKSDLGWINIEDATMRYDEYDFTPYIIKVINPVSVYDSPSYNGKIVGEITHLTEYTIVEESIDYNGETWGKLKSGLGWINLFDATYEYDEDYNNTPEEGHVWCPKCGYDFFTTGVGTEGFTCPECGHNWYP